AALPECQYSSHWPVQCACSNSNNQVLFLLVNGREEYEYFDFTGDCHPHCPLEWVAYRGSCYSFSTEKKDWNSSQESCRAQGAHLLVINDALEMVMVFFGFEEKHFWIGLRNSTSSGWIWEDGSVLSDTRVHSNSPVQNCAVLKKDQFHASSCAVLFQWICEKTLR
uniref:C-type lectin domain-containing protein n=1 Tax=Zonotrichia albicollis TaxID=44394 RepID=A0A8D2NBU6_ZONAL